MGKGAVEAENGRRGSREEAEEVKTAEAAEETVVEAKEKHKRVRGENSTGNSAGGREGKTAAEAEGSSDGGCGANENDARRLSHRHTSKHTLTHAHTSRQAETHTHTARQIPPHTLSPPLFHWQQAGAPLQLSSAPTWQPQPHTYRGNIALSHTHTYTHTHACGT